MPEHQNVPGRRYLELIELVAAASGRKRGWQKRLAAALGVSPSYLSKVIAGRMIAGGDAIERAVERWQLPIDYFLGTMLLPEDRLEAIVGAVEKRPNRRVPIAKASPEEPGYRPALINAHRAALRRMYGVSSGHTDDEGLEVGTISHPGPIGRPELDELVNALMKVRFIEWLVAYQLHRAGFGKSNFYVIPAYLQTTFITEFAEVIEWVRLHPEEPTIHDMLDDVRAALNSD